MFSEQIEALDWYELGTALRESALDAHNSTLPHIGIAAEFLAENPECFGFDEWPAGLDPIQNLEFVMGYMGIKQQEDARV